MENLKRKIDSHRRALDDLVVEIAKTRYDKMHEWQKGTPDKLEKAMERIQEANNSLFMASIALG
jgi:hypothetical protein